MMIAYNHQYVYTLQGSCQNGKALSVMEALVEVLFDLCILKITRACSGTTLMFEYDDVVTKHNYGIYVGSIRKCARDG